MKQSRRIISILLAVCFIMCGMINVHAEGETQDSAVWDGSRDITWYNANPDSEVFYIETAEELAGLAKLVNEGTEDFKGKTIILESDVILCEGDAEDWTDYATDETKIPSEDSAWTPIGYKAVNHIDATGAIISGGAPVSFKGVFDGNGHTVSGVFYNRGQAQQSVGIGLFGFVDGATIKNLSVENSYYKACSAIGGIVGWAIGDVTVSNCYSDAIISIYGRKSYENAHMGYGGIVGRADGAAVTVDNCWFGGKTYHTPDASKNLYANSVGGIVGLLNATEVDIDNCLVTGFVEGNTSVGGVVGACKSGSVDINDTLMLGTVIAEKASGAYGAEFVGLVTGTASVSMYNNYGKAGFKATVGSAQSENVWATDNESTITGWTQDESTHRLSDFELVALVGNELATGDWVNVSEYAYPVPAYFAPAQFMAAQLVDTEGEYYKARFIGTIGDTTGYDSVGYEVIIWDGVSSEAKKFDLEDATVYTSILANADLEEVSVEGKSLIALTIDNIPEACCKYQIRTFVAKDGVRIYGKTVTLDRPDNWK